MYMLGELCFGNESRTNDLFFYPFDVMGLLVMKHLDGVCSLSQKGVFILKSAYEKTTNEVIFKPFLSMYVSVM